MAKKSNPALEKKEEKLHKDLDHDGEKGESAAHKAKVLGKSAPKAGAKNMPAKPMKGGKC